MLNSARKGRSWALRKAHPALTGPDRPHHPTVSCGRDTNKKRGPFSKKIVSPPGLTLTWGLRPGDYSAMTVAVEWGGGGLCSSTTCVWPEQRPEGVWATSRHSLAQDTGKLRQVRVGHVSSHASSLGSFKIPTSSKDGPGWALTLRSQDHSGFGTPSAHSQCLEQS